MLQWGCTLLLLHGRPFARVSDLYYESGKQKTEYRINHRYKITLLHNLINSQNYSELKALG